MNATAKNPNKTCLPPDPNPITPTLVLPPGACDAHCHVFGPARSSRTRPIAAIRPRMRRWSICGACMLA
jgi:hypothetical protein